MSVLLIQEDLELREKIAFSLESTFGEEVLQADGFRSAIDKISGGSPDQSPVPISVIVYDLGPRDKFAAGPTPDELSELFLLTPAAGLVLCVDPKKPLAPQLKWRLLSTVDRLGLIPSLIQSLTRLTDDALIDLPQNEEGFCKIKTKLLLSVCPLEGDIYIRLSEKKFVKLFRRGDEFNLEDLEKYTVQKGVDYLYLRREDLQEFILKYSKSLDAVVAQALSLATEQISQIHESIYETVQECSRRIGFTKEVQSIAKQHVQLTLKQIGKNPKLNHLLENVRASADRYIGSHSLVVGYMACSVAFHMRWGSDATFHKLTLAAFLHDITLTDNRLAHCNTLIEAKELGFSDVVIAEYKTHPIRASEIAQQFHEVPADVDTIVLQHHERPDASGFPRGVGHSHIAPLTAVFIVAHDMAQYYHDHGQKLMLEDFIARNKDRYKTSQFRKVMEAVEKLN